MLLRNLVGSFKPSHNLGDFPNNNGGADVHVKAPAYAELRNLYRDVAYVQEFYGNASPFVSHDDDRWVACRQGKGLQRYGC